MPAPLRLTAPEAPRPKRRRGPVEFSIPDALRRADETFEGPPPRGQMPRVQGRGQLVQRFVLPLALCPTTNTLISMLKTRAKPGRRFFSPAAQARALEEKVFRMMFVQSRVRAVPLPGRPLVRIVRFSSVEPDEGADGMKLCRDLLRMPKPPEWDARRGRPTTGRKGFGFLVDDAQVYVETVRWWEYAPPGKGFGYLDIWTGGGR